MSFVVCILQHIILKIDAKINGTQKYLIIVSEIQAANV